MTEDEMVGWHHRLNGHEFEQTHGDSEGQGRLECCHPWDHKVRHYIATEKQQCNNSVFFFFFSLALAFSLKWQSTTVFLPGKSHGQRNLVGYSPWGLKELDMTEQLPSSVQFIHVRLFATS